MKCEDCLWEELENFDEDSDVREWWIVTPFMAEKEYLSKQTDI